MDFKEFFYQENGSLESKKIVTEEDLFFEATKAQVPSLKAFTAWLVLNNHVSPTIKIKENRKPLSIFEVKASQRVLYLVNEVPNLKELAKEFSFKWSK